MVTGPICKWCGAYLNALESHDEQACYDEHQRRVYAKGAAAARAALKEGTL